MKATAFVGGKWYEHPWLTPEKKEQASNAIRRYLEAA